jgi:hypothetical protein
MRTLFSLLALSVLALSAGLASAGSAVPEDGVPMRTFTPQLPVTAAAQPVEVTPAVSSDGEFPSGAITDTQTLALPMAEDQDDQ